MNEMYKLAKKYELEADVTDPEETYCAKDLQN